MWVCKWQSCLRPLSWVTWRNTFECRFIQSCTFIPLNAGITLSSQWEEEGKGKIRPLEVHSADSLYLPLYDRNVGFLIAILIWWWKEASCKTVLWNHIFSTEHLYKRTSYVKNIPLLLRKYFREISKCVLLINIFSYFRKTQMWFRIQSFTFRFQWEFDQTLQFENWEHRRYRPWDSKNMNEQRSILLHFIKALISLSLSLYIYSQSHQINGIISNLEIGTCLYGLQNKYSAFPTCTTPQITLSAFSAKRQGV